MATTQEAAVILTRDSNHPLGEPGNFSYGFIADTPNTTGGLQFTTSQMDAAREALAIWGDIADLTFVRMEDQNSAYISSRAPDLDFINYNNSSIPRPPGAALAASALTWRERSAFRSRRDRSTS